ncbi:MAG: PSD1 and planctomycete cytochrome C domain-containing protein [Planctomycetota bacterium]
MRSGVHSSLSTWLGSARRCGTIALGVFLLAALGPVSPRGSTSAQTPDDRRFFEEKVRPILVEHCVDCHGGRKVKSGFSLIDRANLLLGGELGEAVDLTHPERSRFLEAIGYDDPHLEMPPKGKLDAEAIATLTRWVQLGVPWTEGEAGVLGGLSAPPKTARTITDEDRGYWAYRPIEKRAAPRVNDPKCNEHPLDAWVARDLDRAGLPTPKPANDATLIRRATYDLTGLPPTPEEVAEYVEDTSGDKWERLIDRLLASPHYGEKWGRHWLDLVRYAETNGYERDSTKLNMWRYRDYVIRAFNQDKPYDRFILEQIAGDELPDATVDSKLATGFHRLMIWDDEPIDRKQSHADVLGDIVDVTGLAFLGTTLGCARCHDHKKDPILQRDYFRMMAFFNNLTPHGTGKAITRPLEDPQRPGESVWTLAQREARVAELNATLDPILETLKSEWIASGREVESPLVTLLPTSEREPQAWWHTFDDPGDHWEAQGFDHSDWKQGPGGFGRRGTPKSRVRTDWHTPVIYLRRNFRLTEIPRRLSIRYHHDDDVEVYVNGVPIFERSKYTVDYQRALLSEEARNALVVGSNSIAVRCRQDFGGQYIDVGLEGGVPPEELRALWITRLKNEGRALLDATTLERGEHILASIDRALALPVRRPYAAPIAFERGRTAPKQFVHLRGNANVPGEEVTPGFPEVMVPAGRSDATVPPLPAEVPSTGRRLALARWLVDPSNPLTARVMANRVWQFHLGRGIVESSSDFGLLGTGATHPELLDHLAVTLVEGGWSLKRLHRHVMTSRTYRMTSRTHELGERVDPNNRLFWRFELRRLTAEEIRDAMLAVNGTLNREQFGPSIYTPLPPEVLATSSRPGQAWGKSPPEQADRRSVYIFVKRSLREAFLESFDQADTDSSCAVRFTTNVPTQTLTMLNGAMVHTEAGEFADRLLREVSGGTSKRVARGLALALGRAPSEDEVAAHVAFVQRLRAKHGVDQREALRLFALAVYNLNEFLFLD